MEETVTAPNPAAPGYGAITIPFHAGRFSRAVHDLYRSAMAVGIASVRSF
jgi:hypothetical protein